MGWFRPSREPGEVNEKQLLARMTIFAIGAIFGLAGIAMQRQSLILIGIVVLFAGMLMRFVRRG